MPDPIPPNSPSPQVTEGVCRICGCVDEQACPEGCAWADETHTLCNTESCLKAAALEPK